MNSQNPSQGVGGSSTASAAAPPPAQGVDSDDPAWKYCALVDANKKHWLKCNYCDKICTAGVTRIKFHLSQIKNCGVTPCPKVPSDVRLEMIALLLKSAELKEKKIEGLEALRTSVDLDHSDGEKEIDEDDDNQVVVLKMVAMKILSLTCSSSACERNWSAFEQVHTKKRSRLLHDRMSDLVFIKFNSRMKHIRENKSRDPIEKTIIDVLEDEDNEFITGIVPNDNVDEHVSNEDQAQQERASTSQAQGKKKKRPTAPPKKKRKKSIHSLLNSIEEEAMLSASSNSSSDSEDESPSALSDSD